MAARQRSAELLDRAGRALTARVERERVALDGRRDALQALGPQATLDRGYAVARLTDGTVVRDPSQAPPGTSLEVIVARGTMETRVDQADRQEDPSA